MASRCHTGRDGHVKVAGPGGRRLLSAALAYPLLASLLLTSGLGFAAFGLAGLAPSAVAGLSAGLAAAPGLAFACLAGLLASSTPASGGLLAATCVFLPRCFAAACSSAVSAATAAINAAPVRVGPV